MGLISRVSSRTYRKMFLKKAVRLGRLSKLPLNNVNAQLYRNLSSTLSQKEKITVKCPPFADSISEGDVAIKFEAGSVVAADDVVLEVETDKTAIAAPSPIAGKVIEILVEDGDTVVAGQDLYIIDSDGAGAAEAAPAAAAAPVAEKAPEPVKEEAPKPVSATLGAAPAVASTPIKTAAPVVTPVAAKAAPASVDAPVSGNRQERRVKMNRMRQRIAQRLKDSQNTCALLTTFNEIDMSNIMELRNKYKEPFNKKHGYKLGFMSAFAKASANALMNAPAVNGVIDDVTQEIVYRDYVDISIAVATPKGLVVPVLRNVEGMNYFDIEKGIAELGAKARDGALAIEDMEGGTFTISNGGVFKSLFGTPIVNPPQSAILGMHGVFDRPVAVNGKVEIRPMMYVALTYDHRIIDGRDAVTFLRNIKDCVEDPRQLLLNL